jgi:hypothetical protein
MLLQNKEKTRNHFWALSTTDSKIPHSNPGGRKGDVSESMMEEVKIC